MFIGQFLMYIGIIVAGGGLLTVFAGDRPIVGGICALAGIGMFVVGGRSVTEK